MTKFTLTLTTLLALPCLAQAQVIPGFTYEKHLKGNDNRGSFDVRYVQISPRAVPNDRVRRPINYKLAMEAREAICEADPARRDQMEANVKMNVVHANREALSVDVLHDYYCGGAYPDGYTHPRLFDLRTGREVEDVSAEFADAEEFKNVVVDKVMANLPHGDDSGCDELYTREQFLERSYHLSVRADGIMAETDFPHAMAACGFPTLVPAADLKPLVKPGSLLLRILR